MAISAAGPYFIFPNSAKAAAPVMLGTGNHRYEWVKGWMKLPDGVKLGSTHGGIVVDSQNRIYASTDGDSSIMVFDQDGKISTPHKIIIDGRGNEPAVLVTDRANHRLQWFTLEGQHVKT